MKIYNWSDLILMSIIGITIIAYQLHNFEGLLDIPLILFGIYIIIRGIRHSLSKERYERHLEAVEDKNSIQKKVLNKYGKKFRILQIGPSVILYLAIIAGWIFNDQDWTVMTLFIAIALYLILTLIVTIIEYQFDDE